MGQYLVTSQSKYTLLCRQVPILDSCVVRTREQLEAVPREAYSFARPVGWCAMVILGVFPSLQGSAYS